MDTQKTAREIGLFEEGRNLAEVVGSAEVSEKVGAAMPLPEDDIGESINQAAAWLQSFGKAKYMFLTPEIALIEQMGKSACPPEEILIVAPCDMDPEAKERLKNNLPQGMDVKILDEPFFPADFYPGNSMIVISGYSGGGRAMVLSDTYRLVEHYSGFRGKKAFVPYREMEAAQRYEGWMEMKADRYNVKWRKEV